MNTRTGIVLALALALAGSAWGHGNGNLVRELRSSIHFSGGYDVGSPSIPLTVAKGHGGLDATVTWGAGCPAPCHVAFGTMREGHFITQVGHAYSVTDFPSRRWSTRLPEHGTEYVAFMYQQNFAG